MFYYLIVAIVILLFYISEKAGSKIWAFAAILLLAFVGAFRDDTIGVDVMVYGQKYFETAVSSTSFKEYSLLIKTEPLFLILNFLISRLTKEYYWMQFACQLLTILPVYFCSLYWKQKYSLVLCFIIYLLLFHFQSYNNIKQYIALSFCLCAYTALLLDKKKLYILFTAIAITAHLTSVISILFALLFYVHKIKSPKKIILIDTAVLVFLVGFLFIFKDVLSIMLSNGLDDRYTFYLDNQNNSAVLDKAKILTWLISIVLLIFCFYKSPKKRECGFIIMIVISGYILDFSGYIMPYANRLSLYFLFFSIIGIPYALYTISYTSSRKRVLALLYTSLLLINFYYLCIYNGGVFRIYPYTSKILEIRL